MGGWTLLCKTEDKLCLLLFWPLEFSLVSYKDRVELQKICTESSLDLKKQLIRPFIRLVSRVYTIAFILCQNPVFCLFFSTYQLHFFSTGANKMDGS